jgi:beta-galactosidase
VTTRDDRVTALRRRLAGFAYGGDYNPEQWPEDVWAEDVQLMKEAGVTMVSLGIFGWAQVEPEPGEFDFAWFDRVMDLLHGGDVAVCLATMTASPPPWMSQRHPEILPMRADGTRLWPGGRQHYCPSSPIYREYATRLVDTLASRCADHPALALWHIGNEYGCHVSDCYCDVSAEAFRRWLRDRYGDLDGLNDAWSTTFWSQRYTDWEQVLPPRTQPAFSNPGQRLDFARFSSDEMLACYRVEKAVLDRITPEVPATTNFLGVWKSVDFFAWAPHVDVVSHDSYPDPHDLSTVSEVGFAYDLMRSLGDGDPWLLMEQAPSAVNWRDRNGPKPPGVMRLWSWQAIAHGADSVLSFQWRQSRGGAEKFHSAMVPHGGPDTRIHREVQQLGRELAEHPEIAGTRLRSDVAIVMDWSDWWAVELDSHPSTDVRLIETVLAHYRPLYDANVTCDVVPPGADLSGYRLVVVPNLYLVGPADAANLTEYVRKGGTLVMSYFSGVVDRNDRVHLGGYPAPFRELLGLRVEEFWPLPEDGTVALTGDLGGTGTVWSEDIDLEGAEQLAAFADGDLAGRPAITRHRLGNGTAYYCGTRPDPETMRRLLDQARSVAGVKPSLPGLPPGVQARTRRADDGTAYHIVLNHTDDPVTVTVAENRLSLAPRDVAVVRTPPQKGTAR